MECIGLNQTRGRGRNGWFRARNALVQRCGACVEVDVVSSTPAVPGPIRLELSPDDAESLALGILRAAGVTTTPGAQAARATEPEQEDTP